MSAIDMMIWLGNKQFQWNEPDSKKQRQRLKQYAQHRMFRLEIQNNKPKRKKSVKKSKTWNEEVPF